MLGDKGSQTTGVGALKSLDDGLVFEEEKSGHGSHTVALCHLLYFIDVDFEKDSV